MEERAFPDIFGEWLKIRRKELDLTQAELAQRAGCSVPALRKIEAGERRPSKQLAGLLAKSLEIPAEDQTTFIKVARGEQNVERLASTAYPQSGIIRPTPITNPPLGNLPRLLTKFIGRGPEIASLDQLLHDLHCRLITLVGPGGIGKTRLALEVASRNKDLFPDGVWFVPLAPLSSPEYLIPAIADALNFKCHGLTDPRNNLLNYLRDKQTLLVIDNTEHLLDGSYLFADILENSSQVKLLVTSRERMNLRSEWVFEIHGLPVPPTEKVEQFDEFSSVALFLESTQRIKGNFELHDDEERHWVLRICQMMDGMPLGIELAAAWVGLLSCEEIAKEIERNLDFLTVSLRDLPERHRSIRATLDYSWHLLNPEEKAVLSRLSVFRGSFSREAAEKICGANLTILHSLKNKSLLHRTARDRFDLHELVQQYAALRLAEDIHEEQQVRDQHAEHFAQCLSRWEKNLKSSKQVETLLDISYEIDNLRQAWEQLIAWCIEDRHRGALRSPALFHSSLFSLNLFYEMRCRNQEAISLFGQSVEMLREAKGEFESPEDRWFLETVFGHILAYLGLHYAYIQQYKTSYGLLEEALALLKSSIARAEIAQALGIFAWICQTQGQIQKSLDILDESLIIFQEEGEDWWYLRTLVLKGWGYLLSGRIQESLDLFQQGLHLVVPGDIRLGIPIRNGLARINYLQNEYDRAEQLLRESLELSYQLGSKRKTARCYLDLGQVALATGRLELAGMNFRECVNLLCEFGESHDLALGFIYLGKYLAARQDTEAARNEFLKVIRIGQSLDIFYLVYWGLVNLARVLLQEGRSDTALEIERVLKYYSVEVKVAQDDADCLMAELKGWISTDMLQAAVDQPKDSTIESLLAQI